MPGDPGVTVVTNSRVFYYTRGCGRIGRPAFPAPSDVQGAGIKAKLGRNARRDREILSANDRLFEKRIRGGPSTSLRGAKATKQSILRLRRDGLLPPSLFELRRTRRLARNDGERVGKGALRAVPTMPAQIKMVGTLALCPPYAFECCTPRKISARALLAGTGGVGLQRPDALGQRAAALGGSAARGRAIGSGAVGGLRRLRRDHRLGSQHGLDRRVRPFELHRKLCDFGGDVVDALAQ